MTKTCILKTIFENKTFQSQYQIKISGNLFKDKISPSQMGKTEIQEDNKRTIKGNTQCLSCLRPGLKRGEINYYSMQFTVLSRNGDTNKTLQNILESFQQSGPTLMCPEKINTCSNYFTCSCKEGTIMRSLIHINSTLSEDVEI